MTTPVPNPSVGNNNRTGDEDQPLVDVPPAAQEESSDEEHDIEDVMNQVQKIAAKLTSMEKSLKGKDDLQDIKKELERL